MNETIFTILKNHEIEDEKVVKSMNKMVAVIKAEFANADDVLAKAFELIERNINPFEMENGVINFPIIPVRKEQGIHIRKHTMSQIPYIHYHNFYELIFVSKGKCEQLVQNRKIVMEQGDLCILSPKIEHAILQITQKDIVVKIVIPTVIFDSINANCRFNEPMELVHNVSAEAEYLLFKILKESFVKDRYFNDTMKNYLALLFIELARNKNDDCVFLNKIMQYIDANIQNANLENFAKSLGYNKSYLSRVVKQKTHKTYSELLIDCRMKKASQMIFDNMRIDDIAFELGYQNTSGFYKQFSKYYGMTPFEYKHLL